MYQVSQIGRKRTQLFLILNRAELFFNEINIEGKKRIKSSEIQAIQKNFTPVTAPSANVIYRMNGREGQRYLFWMGNIDVAEDTVFYDEIPETLLFKGDPARLGDYRVFVFRRIAGFEIIYSDGLHFYSYFEGVEDRVPERVVAVTRKFGLREDIPVLSDIDLPANGRLRVDLLAGDQPLYIVTNHLPIQKIFSNISRDKKLSNIKRIVRSVHTYMNILLGLLVLVLAAQILNQVLLQKDKNLFSDKWRQINRVVEDSDQVEMALQEIKKKVRAYPDHSGYLKAIHEAMDDDSFLLSYALIEDRINLEGYARDSLAILARLEGQPFFTRVGFKSPVKKNIYSQTERFYIEIVLKKND